MTFIIGKYNNIYHETYKYSGIYHTKCKQDDLIFPEFGTFTQDKNYIYPNTLYPKLNINTICKKCMELNKINIEFYLIKIKLGIKCK